MCRAWFARSFFHHVNNIVDVWRSFHRKLWWQWWCQWEYCLLSPSILILSTVITIACDCIYEREQVEVSDTPWNYCIAFHANRFVVLSSSWAGGTAIYTCVHMLSCFLKLFATVHVGMSIKHNPDICRDADPCSGHAGGHLASSVVSRRSKGRNFCFPAYESLVEILWYLRMVLCFVRLRFSCFHGLRPNILFLPESCLRWYVILWRSRKTSVHVRLRFIHITSLAVETHGSATTPDVVVARGSLSFTYSFTVQLWHDYSLWSNTRFHGPTL